jgi:hypothetical protein
MLVSFGYGPYIGGQLCCSCLKKLTAGTVITNCQPFFISHVTEMKSSYTFLEMPGSSQDKSTCAFYTLIWIFGKNGVL